MIKRFTFILLTWVPLLLIGQTSCTDIIEDYKTLNPVEMATLQLVYHGEINKMVLTDKAGYYLFSNIPMDNHYLEGKYELYHTDRPKVNVLNTATNYSSILLRKNKGNKQNTSIKSISIEGFVIDADTRKPIAFGAVALMKNGLLVKATETDIYGKYTFYDINEGLYSLEVSYIGYDIMKATNIRIEKNTIIHKDFQIKENGKDISIICFSFPYPLFDLDCVSSGAIISSYDIRHMPIPK